MSDHGVLVDVRSNILTLLGPEIAVKLFRAQAKQIEAALEHGGPTSDPPQVKL